MSPARRRGRPGSAGKAVTFHGPPSRLTGLLPEAPAGGEPEVSLARVEVRHVSLRGLGVGPGATVTIRVAESTAPGMYEGTLRIGEAAFPAVAEVEARPRLRGHPSRLSLAVGPAAESAAEVTVVNVGNTPCEVSGRSKFGLLDDLGPGHAFWTALTSEPPRGKQRVDVLLDDLAGTQGGLVEVSVEDGGTIPPGGSRTVRLALRFSDRLRPGHSYSGTWEPEGLRLPVRVTVPKAAPKRPAKAAG